ncbi:MAG: DUF1553 domain-containing protein [Verrucomicrobia bacterium]|nr:DUF1553 domain-containing protein [Verrucomicrobiota bacterium]
MGSTSHQLSCGSPGVPSSAAPAPHRAAFWRTFVRSLIPALVPALTTALGLQAANAPLDFNRDIRRILSDTCFQCHGPDAGGGKPGKKALRLDLPDAAKAVRDGHAAIVPGQPEQSEVVRRITSTDPDDRMPPPDSGKSLSPADRATLVEWIRQGATYSRHWAYVPPERPPVPPVADGAWPRNAIDRFILARLEQEGLKPGAEADAQALERRASLDLTGLPPSASIPGHAGGRAVERTVDDLLASQAYGEHWARLWLDLARYADSSGYADDPARTIWAYRDYVIRSFNANKPFDVFTLEQLAGDLLPNPTEEQMVATAFHRNTMTNNEGGTNDEEFRNVALVDRVNTTMAVWMGTTMACAQCHNHKYDPITQEEYFRLFAILNNTADADRGDESPVMPLFTEEQKRTKARLEAEITGIEAVLARPTPPLERDQTLWEARVTRPLDWQTLIASTVSTGSGAPLSTSAEGLLHVDPADQAGRWVMEFRPTEAQTIQALRLEVLTGNAAAAAPRTGEAPATAPVVSRVQARIVPATTAVPKARIVRIELPGKERILSLAEVQVFHGDKNLARGGEARQSSTAYEGPARLAIDGNTNGDFNGARSTTHTQTSTDPWWEVDLKEAVAIDRLSIWNRTDGSGERLAGFRVVLLDENRAPVWDQVVAEPPKPSRDLRPDASRPVEFSLAVADLEAPGFEASVVLGNPDPSKKGWSPGPRQDRPAHLTLVPRQPFQVGPGSNLVVTLEPLAAKEGASPIAFRLGQTLDPRVAEIARTPAPVLEALSRAPSARTDAQKATVAAHHRSVAPRLQPDRDRLAALQRQRSEIKPHTTVPVLRELAGKDRRKTRLQLRGNWMNLGDEVSEGLPSALGPVARGKQPDRLQLARWLVDRGNPLTARVVANRLWESVFGIGLVRTSEEFGSQGEPPSHPELLDWLAVELMDSGWDLKHLLRLMATSATYRQSSKVSPELIARDPENRLLARGPRFRLPAETIRDQAMAVSGLLSVRMHGPPVKPAQPKLGLTAAFGSGTDWETSGGEDRFRRGLYTTWRRSNPYPSMATFDAPNREVCQVRRERSNTPLQALVTLNDPVYVEAAQALGRRLAQTPGQDAQRLREGFRRCLHRDPSGDETARLQLLLEGSRQRFEADPDKARRLATEPIGDLPRGLAATEAAAWTSVANVLLNLDEFLMKR